MAQSEKFQNVFVVGCEGGSLKILRRADGLYTTCVNEVVLYDLMNEDYPGLSWGEWGSFEDALNHFEESSWTNLYPLYLHPDVAPTVLERLAKLRGEESEPYQQFSGVVGRCVFGSPDDL